MHPLMDQETPWDRYVDATAACTFAGLLESCEPQGNEPRTVFSGPAIDRLKLPPPGIVISFSRFLVRLVQSEYGIVTSSDADWDTAVDPTHTDDDAMAGSKDALSEADRPIDLAVLHDAVHELLFSRIPRITIAFATDLDDDSAGSGNQLSTGECEPCQPTRLLYPWHWAHSKRSILGLSAAELAFPPDVVHSIMTFTAAHDQEIRQRGFLPETLEALRAVERAITPAGIVRTVMMAFRVLHRELVRVLADAASATDSVAIESNHLCAPKRRRPMRRTSCFLNADVLIPSLVLLFSRVPRAEDLDVLWLRLQSVHAFRRALLSDGCEEAYYVTCLTAAMEFVSGAALSAQGSCEQCRQRRAQLVKCCRVQARDTTPLPSVLSSSSSQIRWSASQETSIQRLSQWISEQSSLPDIAQDAFTEENLSCLVAPHELLRIT
ncbi:hypothetical protein PINS_up013266 [Pythium insidiosum]|nr:hypothetical protein PINS_up013266 [Pythium insidiosum]